MAPAEARTLHSPARSVGAAPGGGGNEDQVDMQIVASERPSLSCTAICESKASILARVCWFNLSVLLLEYVALVSQLILYVRREQRPLVLL